MPTPFLGSNIFEVIPTIQASGLSGGDPLTVSQLGTNNIPSLIGSSAIPSVAPTYGAGSINVDITNGVIYLYESSSWSPISITTPNAVSLPTIVPVDFSYLVVGYIKI